MQIRKQPLPAKQQDAPDDKSDKSKEPARKWFSSFGSPAAARPNEPERPRRSTQEPVSQGNKKTGIAALQRLVDQLEAPGTQPDQKLLTDISATVGSIFEVRADEVALLKLAPHGLSLGFVLPAKLQAAGAIPVESKVATAARTVRERRPEILNAFESQPHARVFEVISPEQDASEPIQKILSAPIFRSDQLIGVAQISRKGATPVAAGPDFTDDDLKQLQDINPLLARIIGAKMIDVVGTAADAPAAQTQNPISAKRRRAPRVTIEIPVEVIYQGSGNKLLAEEAKTCNVSAYGAAIILKNAPRVEQAIVLIHKKTREEVFCRVADTRQLPKSTDHEVGVAFTEPRPYFWRIAFPSPDFDPTERKQFSSTPGNR